MIFSDLPRPAEAPVLAVGPRKGFAQAGNRYTPRIKSGAGFFGIMLSLRAFPDLPQDRELDGCHSSSRNS